MAALSTIILLMNIFFKLMPKCNFELFKVRPEYHSRGERRSWRSKGKFLMIEFVFASYASIYKTTSVHSQWRGHNKRKNSEEGLVAIHNLMYKLLCKKKFFPITPYTFFIRVSIITFLKIIIKSWILSLLNIQCNLFFLFFILNTLWNNYQQSHTLGYLF